MSLRWLTLRDSRPPEREGQRILVALRTDAEDYADGESLVRIAVWRDDHGWVADGYEAEFTHWMPLPEFRDKPGLETEIKEGN